MGEPGWPAASPPDVIALRGLRVSGICGALPEERERPQPLEVDLDVVTDLGPAGRSDDLADTIDYAGVIDTVERIIDSARPRLLEHLAERIAAAVLDGDGRVDAVTVSLRKLRPPVPQQMASAGVRITRRRDESLS